MIFNKHINHSTSSDCQSPTPIYFIAIFFIFFQLLSNHSYGQDPIFSQYYASSLYLNPAYSGMEPDLAFSSIGRSQWRDVSPHVTGNFSAIIPFHNHETLRSHWGGAGLSAYYDKSAQSGLLKNTGVNASFSYNIFLGEFGYQQISFGLQAGFVQKQLNLEALEWGSGYTRGDNTFDPVANTLPTSNIMYPDIASGIIWSYNSMKDIAVNNISAYAGVAAYHINAPNTSLLSNNKYSVPRLFKFHAGLEWQMTDKLGISPNILAAFQENYMQVNGGVYFTYKLISSTEGKLANTSLIAGTWYRLNDGVILSTGLTGHHFTLGLSYDLNNSSFNNYPSQRGAYEISLAIRFIKRGNVRRYDSPRI